MDSANSATPSILDVPPVRTIPAGILFSNPFLWISANTNSNNSTYLGSIISDKTFLDSSRGGLPPTPATSIESASFVNSETAQPNFCFSSSAWGVGVLKATAISLVTWSPAIGITPVKHIDPLLNIAMSVVPPPISTIQTPSSFSSFDNIEYELANCSRTKPSIPIPHLFTHFSIFWIALFAQVTKWTCDSSLTPDMPSGSRIASWSSITNSCGSTCNTLWSEGIATAWAASITFSISSWVTSLSLTPTIPWEFKLFMWFPAMPTKTFLILPSKEFFACSIDFCIASVVASIFTTTPFFNPDDGYEPIATISIEWESLILPIKQTTLEVPISSAAM